MLKGEKTLKYRRFEYYLRQCDDCANLFKCKTKKGIYCPDCKSKRSHIKISNSLKARGFDFKKIIDLKMIGIEKPKKKKKVNSQREMRSNALNTSFSFPVEEIKNDV